MGKETLTFGDIKNESINLTPIKFLFFIRCTY